MWAVQSMSMASGKGVAAEKAAAAAMPPAPTLVDLVVSQLNTIAPTDIVFEQFKLLGESHRCLGSAPPPHPGSRLNSPGALCPLR